MEHVVIDVATDAPQKSPTMLIVSSYHRACGIAQYVEFLEVALRNQHHLNIDIASLPVDLLRSQSPYARRAVAAEFDAILAAVRAADVVNLQLEPGLLGFTSRRIWRRLKAIINESKRLIITYHTVPQTVATRFQLSKRGLLRYLRSWRGDYVFTRLFREIRRNPAKFHHIVHTAREARNFVLLGVPADTITHRPLSFIDKERREKIDPELAQKEIRARFGIPSGRLLGCFGFLSEYKGIEIAIRAMSKLPQDHHLLIVGGLHPEGMAHSTINQPYIAKLIAEVENLKSVASRVHFCGSLDNDDFYRMMAGCDAVILPYAEMGQTSSGPAAMALDMQRPVYCSRNRCFEELDSYQHGMLSFFEVGNHIELAEKLRQDEGNSWIRQEARARYLNAYSVEHRAAAYVAAAQALLSRR